MVSTQGVWKRLGGAFRSNGAADPPRIFTNHDANGSGNGAAEPAALRSADGPASAVTRVAPAPRSRWSWLPWRRRAEERTERVAAAVEALQRHFERQDRRAVELTGAVDSLARSMRELVELHRGQSATLTELTAGVQAASRTTTELSAALIELPASVQAQADAVRGLGRRFDQLGDGQAEVRCTLGRIHASLEAGRAATDAQTESLRRVQAEGQDSRRELQATIRRHSRRLVTAIVGSATAGVAALVTVALLAS